MHFIAAATLIGSALASGVYYETTSAYYTTTAYGKPTVYTSVSTCTEKAPVYHTTTPYAKPYGSYGSSAAPYYSSSKPVYTSYASVYASGHVYSSAVYSTCTEESVYAKPTPSPYGGYASPAPYYSPPANTTSCTEEYGYETTTASVYAAPTYVPTYTNTYYTTVNGYATTVTSTWCPSSTPAAVYTPTTPAYVAPVYTPSSSPCPTANATATYAPPPSYTGAASSNVVSFGLAVAAGLTALFIAA